MSSISRSLRILVLFAFVSGLVGYHVWLYINHDVRPQNVFEDNDRDIVRLDAETKRNNVAALNPAVSPVEDIQNVHAQEAEEPKGALQKYIEVIDGCGPHFGGACLNVRSGPSTSSPAVHQLRTGVVLKVGETVEVDGEVWHKIVFDEWLRYPERLRGDWYVSGEYVRLFEDAGSLDLSTTTPTTSKEIIVDRSDQRLYAYDGDELFLETDISTGLTLTPTPRGTFTIFRKTPSRYMQGPLPYLEDKEVYDLPGVPWNLYFTDLGAVIHGAYWHTSFGSQYSHGCVNASPELARQIYEWADLGTKVVVRD